MHSEAFMFPVKHLVFILGSSHLLLAIRSQAILFSNVHTVVSVQNFTLPGLPAGLGWKWPWAPLASGNWICLCCWWTWWFWFWHRLLEMKWSLTNVWGKSRDPRGFCYSSAASFVASFPKMPGITCHRELRQEMKVLRAAHEASMPMVCHTRLEKCFMKTLVSLEI